MSEHAGEKTEQATPKRLEEAVKRGQFARSPEVQTVFVILAGLMGLKFAGLDIWHRFIETETYVLGHLHEVPITFDSLHGQAVKAVLVFASCTGPVAVMTLAGGLLAGGLQSRFQTASEALSANWERVNPLAGFKRIFSARAYAAAGVASLKMMVVAGLSYSQVQSILKDPIFFTVIDTARISRFLAEAAFGIGWRVILGLMVLAAVDYGYQFWKTSRELMMTKEELREELKNTEGDPHIKARQRRRRKFPSQRQMLSEVPQADVVVTNPTHLAVALRYDRKSMKAPRIVAKGARLNAQRIREVAAQHQVPVIENKVLARMMFKYGRVGAEIPAELYTAVAEVLAYVYRSNRYRYYAQQNRA